MNIGKNILFLTIVFSINAACGQDECNILKIAAICAKKMGVQCLNAKHIKSDETCVKVVKADTACVTNLKASNFCIDGNIIHCSKLRAQLGLSVNAAYTLGSIISYDTIVDDPNGSVLGNTTYVVPESGYYLVTLSVGALSLTGPTVIAGTPVSFPEVLVNGVSRLKSIEAFLTFNVNQNNITAGVIHLKKGDLITTRYNVLSFTATGLTPFAGTATLQGSLAFDETYLIIHYLSSDCPTPSCPPCPPCTTCETPNCNDCFPPTDF